jgi:hypothetical protein
MEVTQHGNPRREDSADKVVVVPYTEGELTAAVGDLEELSLHLAASRTTCPPRQQAATQSDAALSGVVGSQGTAQRRPLDARLRPAQRVSAVDGPACFGRMQNT